MPWSIWIHFVRFDDGFHKLLLGSLLVCDPNKRKTLAQCLSDPYLESDSHRAGWPNSRFTC